MNIQIFGTKKCNDTKKQSASLKKISPKNSFIGFIFNYCETQDERKGY